VAPFQKPRQLCLAKRLILRFSGWKVAEDLRAIGYELYRPVGTVHHVVAVKRSVNTRNAIAMRIVVRASEEELTKNADFYQAVVSPDQDLRVSPVTFYPSLTD
jgi:hypothetical protein